MARVTGRVEVLLNGEMLLNKAGAIARGIGISGEPSFEMKPVVGDTGLHGFIEEPIIPECEVKLTDTDQKLLSDLARIRENGTVIFRAARGGKAYIMEGATCARNFELTAGEGEVSVKFYGRYWTETVENAI